MNILGYEINTLNQTCYACPAQWDAFAEDGTYIYIRYRWGYLSATIDVSGEKLYGKQCGDEFSGFMTTEQMIDHLSMRVEHEVNK